jgi:RNA polymerase sigma factor (sigma-70 family)
VKESAQKQLLQTLERGLNALLQQEEAKKSGEEEISEVQKAMNHIRDTLEKAWDPDLIARECLNKFFTGVEILEGESLAQKMKEILKKMCSKDSQEVSTISALIEKGQKGDRLFEISIENKEDFEALRESLNRQEYPAVLAYFPEEKLQSVPDALKSTLKGFPENREEVYLETLEPHKRWLLLFDTPCTKIERKNEIFSWTQGQKSFEMETKHRYIQALDESKFPRLSEKDDEKLKKVLQELGLSRSSKSGEYEILEEGKRWEINFKKYKIKIKKEEENLLFSLNEQGSFQVSVIHPYLKALDQRKIPKFLDEDLQNYEKQIDSFGFNPYPKLGKVKVFLVGEKWCLFSGKNSFSIEAEDQSFIFYSSTYKLLSDTILLQFSRRLFSYKRNEFDTILADLLSDIYQKGLPSFKRGGTLKHYFKGMIRKTIEGFRKKDLEHTQLLKKNALKKNLISYSKDSKDSRKNSDSTLLEERYPFLDSDSGSLVLHDEFRNTFLRFLDDNLPRNTKEIIIERYFENHSYPELGKKYNKKPDTVRKSVERTLKEIKPHLSKYIEEDPFQL